MATQWAARMAAEVGVLSEELNSLPVSRGAQEVAARAENATDLIEELQFSSIKSIRTSIITMASFNVLAAAVTLACIVWDCYLAAKRKDKAFKIRYEDRRRLASVPDLTDRALTMESDIRLRHIGAPQVYPLVLCLGIIAQGIIFATAQARGLDALQVDNCVAVSQMMMPGMLNQYWKLVALR
jgi:hypothetical protein